MLLCNFADQNSGLSDFSKMHCLISSGLNRLPFLNYSTALRFP